MHETVSQIVTQLDMRPHPEGGYFKETFRSTSKVKTPARFEGGERDAGTCIHYLLAEGDFSSWHLIQGDETWIYEAGSPITVYWIDTAGERQKCKLGHVLKHAGATPQVTIPNNCWFAAIIEPEDFDPNEPYCLVACAVYPGFDFRDFSLADRAELANTYPDHEDIIERLTRVATV